MSNLTIIGRTPGSCGCCNTADPGCEIECISSTVQGCALGRDGDCDLPYSYPIAGTGCFTLYNFIPCPCEEPPHELQITSRARLHLTGLTPGRTYTATLFFQKTLTFPIEETFVSWTFVATAADDYTDYVNVPNPAALDEVGWFAVRCTIVGASCSFECYRSGETFRCIEGAHGYECFMAPVDHDLLCLAEYHAPDPDGCGSGIECPTEVAILSIFFRAYCNGLSIGSTYRVSRTFTSNLGTSSIITITFTATASAQFTDWTAGPVPDATNSAWAAIPGDPCSIEKI